MDDKSGYDNIFLHLECRHLTGFQFRGYYFVCNTLPFGWKNSAYCYHTLNSQVAAYLRQWGVPIWTYIDDRLIGEVLNTHLSPQVAGYHRALCAVFATAEVVCRLGIFISVKKSVFTPSTMIRFLGLHIHSIQRAFSIPDDKIYKFAMLREAAISATWVSIQSLQRIAGKCISFLLAIPSAKLYIAEMSKAISDATRARGKVRVDEHLREELLHWRFIDLEHPLFPWFKETHATVSIQSDSSLYKWGATAHLGSTTQVLADYWPEPSLHAPFMS